MGVESDPSAVRIRKAGDAALGGKGFRSRGGPEEGLPTLLLGAELRSPSLGVKGREPVLGVKLRPPGRGVKLRPPGRGVKLRPPGRGVKLRPPGRGVKLRPPGRGVRLRPAGRGVKLREPARGVRLLEPERGDADLGPLLNPSRGFEMRGRGEDDGRSVPAGRSVLFTNFDSVDDAGFALCTRGLSPIGFAFKAGRRVVGPSRRAGRADEVPVRVEGFRGVSPTMRVLLISRRGGGML